jgi:hypothetical protein
LVQGFVSLSGWWITVIEALFAVERFLLLSLVLGVIEVFATTHHVDAFVLAWSRKLLQALVLLVVGDEVCMKRELQFFGYAVLGRME